MRILKLPVNEYWYGLIKSGQLKHDYREIKPYWTKRLEGQSYDAVEFYHRFKKNIKPLRRKIMLITTMIIRTLLCKPKEINYNMDAYIIKFGEMIPDPIDND